MRLTTFSASAYLRSCSRQGSAAWCSLSSTPSSRPYSAQDSVRLIYSSRSAVADNYRKPGQGGDADNQHRDLRAELLAAEAAHQAKKNGMQGEGTSSVSSITKRPLQLEEGHNNPEDEDADAKRRRILEETRDIDADSEGGGSESSEEESEEEDETAELMRELEKIKRERAEEKAKEVRQCS